MKRQAKPSPRRLSPEKEKELRHVRAKVLREEKAEISAEARRAFADYEVELARAAELLKSEREAQGLTLAQIEGRTGIDRAVLCRVENLVAANPTVGTLDKIARAMGKKLIVGLQERQ